MVGVSGAFGWRWSFSATDFTSLSDHACLKAVAGLPPASSRVCSSAAFHSLPSEALVDLRRRYAWLAR
eukprot:13699459-Alexandrium_andersonii.AAC.1